MYRSMSFFLLIVLYSIVRILSFISDRNPTQANEGWLLEVGGLKTRAGFGHGWVVLSFI